MGDAMKKQLLALAIPALLLTGCSAPTPELKYDELDIIKYEKCLEDSFASFCEKFKPEKK